MTIALYCRVSTDEQAQHGHSIESQIQRLEAYCKSQGWSDYEFYIDDGYTGTSMDRPQLKRLIRHIEQKRISSVVVYRLDRLSRKQRDVLWLIEDVFEANGVSFRSATEPFDTSTPLGKAMLGILAVFAQLERDTIVERTRSGIAQRARKGLWHGGPVPFGYDWDKENKQLVVNPTESPLVKEVFRRFLDGKSLNSIANWLRKRNTSRYVDHTFINDMLKRPAYAGLIPRDGGVLPGTHEAIISEEQFWQTQEELKRRSEGRRPYGKYLLSNIAECGLCGATYKMQVQTHHKYPNYVYRFYMCASKHKAAKYCPDSKRIEYRRLEEMVVSQIKQVANSDEDIAEFMQKNSFHVDDNTEEIERLQNELQSIDVKMDNLVSALRDGVLTSRQIKTHVDELEQRRQQIETRLDELQDAQTVPRQFDDIIESIKTIGQSWDKLTEEEQRDILRYAVKKVIVYPDREPEIIWNT